MPLVRGSEDKSTVFATFCKADWRSHFTEGMDTSSPEGGERSPFAGTRSTMLRDRGRISNITWCHTQTRKLLYSVVSFFVFLLYQLHIFEVFVGYFVPVALFEVFCGSFCTRCILSRFLWVILSRCSISCPWLLCREQYCLWISHHIF